MAGKVPSGKVLIFDDDHYYMGGVIAELAAQNGAEVTLVTPAAYVSEWTLNTLEQGAIHARLAAAGIEIVLNKGVSEIRDGSVQLACTYTGTLSEIEVDAVVMVTSQSSTGALWNALEAREDEWADQGIQSIQVIGDAKSPAPIAWATYAGHRYGREMDNPNRGDALPFRREVVVPTPKFRL